MATPNFALPLYTGDDTGELDVLLNGQSSALDAALTANIWNFSGTDAQRLTLAAPRLRAGVGFYATDTGVQWKYTGVKWLPDMPGLSVVRPTSITGGSMATDGSLLPSSGSAQLAVDGAFSGEYRAYRLVFQCKTVAVSGLLFQYRRAATNISSATYSQVRIQAASGTVSSIGALTNTYYDMVASGSQVHIGEILISAVAQTGVKSIKSDIGSVAGAAPLNSQMTGFNGSPDMNSPVDGFRIYTTSGNFDPDSWFKLYGLN